MPHYDHFSDRREAGRLLGEALAERALDNPVVLALPRGGVPVGYEVAKKLKAPLDILLVRKIGAPGQEEYGIGAIVDGPHPQVLIDEQAAQMAGADKAYIDRIVARELTKLERRRAAYGNRSAELLKDRTVILVDDGIATGRTAKAALMGLSQSGAAYVTLAVPVAPPDTLSQLGKLCDEVVCLISPAHFYAVGAHYDDFNQTTDEDVIRLLSQRGHEA